MEVHQLEVYYPGGKRKRELYVFRYKDFPVCTYSKNTRFAKFRGMVHSEWYRYSKTGELSEKPERVSDTDGICYFNVSKCSDVYLPDELRSHSPIEVIEK